MLLTTHKSVLVQTTHSVIITAGPILLLHITVPLYWYTLEVPLLESFKCSTASSRDWLTTGTQIWLT